MFQGAFKKRKRKNEVFLTLDIGTEAVKALIFSDSFFQKKTLILGAGMAYFQKNRFKEAILEAVKKARSNSAFSLAKKELKKKIEKKKEWEALLGLPSDVLRARIVSRVFLREDSKKRISKKEQEAVKNQVFESAKKEVSSEVSKEFGILASDIEWLSLEIISVKIDGYPVSSLIGYQGRRIEFKIMITFIPKNHLERIKKVLSSLNLKIIKMVHMAQGLSIMPKEDGLFIDVGGEITQIFEARNNQIEHISEFKNGARDFIEDLSQRLGIDIDTARSLEEDYSKNLLSPGSLKKIKEIFSWERKIWYDKLKEKLEGSKSSNIFLFGGGSFLSDIQNILKENPIFSNAPKVDFIYLEDLKDIINTTKGLDSPQYIPSLLLTLANA